MKEITFKTKFELGEKVLHYNTFTGKLEEFTIAKISFDLYPYETRTWYHDDANIFCSEDNIFRSKQEFIDSL